MSVESDVARLAPMQVVEMFIFDATEKYPTSPILRWHPGTQVDGEPIVWQGFTYYPFPVEVSGIDEQTQGKLPRPTLRASNIGGQLGALLRSIGDGLGAKVTRKRTLGKYLDAVNFPGGNPNADPSTYFDDDVFFVARRVSSNPIFVEYEMAVAFDVTGILLPRRQVIASTCMWVYRSAECSYAGGAILNDPVYPGVDQCGKTLTACKLRFGANGVLPTSAFPASLLARYV
jgi:lambda family phage minor tail protein L